jgi:serine/threonine-protein phosphatase 5
MTADSFKQEGNEWFKLCKYQKAIDCYSQALELDRNPVLLCNRAFAYVKSELPGAALIDADEALTMDPNFVKAYYRKASAHIELGKFKDALRDLKVVLQLVPDDGDAKQKYDKCDKEVKRINFLNAIVTKEGERISKCIKLNEIKVPESYNGPRITGDCITQQFVLDMTKHFREEKVIARRDLIWLLLRCLEIFTALPNFVSVEVPPTDEITVCGDTHGQFFDLMNIFEMNGLPSESNRYLFNGDFVDRGSYSLETVTTLFAFKALYPEHIFLSRGNHEGLPMNRVYGFEGEVKAKYDDTVFQLFSEVFNSLPVGHIINKKVFVVHGGLYSKDDVTISELQKPSRFGEIPESGLICESMWADPQPMKGRSPSNRGVGLSFGPDVTENFLRTNGLDLIIRSHECKDEGYVVEHDGKCITVFSAPNYCDQMGNKGAFIRLKGNNISKPNFTTFTHVKHPGKRPMAYSSALGSFM